MFKNEKNKILACFFREKKRFFRKKNPFFSGKKKSFFFPKKTSLFFSGCNPIQEYENNSYRNEKFLFWHPDTRGEGFPAVISSKNPFDIHCQLQNLKINDTMYVQG